MDFTFSAEQEDFRARCRDDTRRRGTFDLRAAR